MRCVIVGSAIVLAGCGSSKKAPARDDAAAVAIDAPVIELVRRPLGADRVDAFGWRRRVGHDAYRRAVVAEKAARWSEVVAACREARSADPTHLEAAWLEAAAQARLGALGDVLPALEVAAAGDWGKWGERSLTLDLFAAFRDTPTGRAWTRAAAVYRDDYAAAMRRALVIGAGGDLHAFDPGTSRWLRVTRAGGAVIAALPSPDGRSIATVVRRKQGDAWSAAIAVVDLATGRASRETPVPGDKLKVRWRVAPSTTTLEIADARNKPSRIDWHKGKRIAADGKGKIATPWLAVAGARSRLVRLPVDGVTADWDDRGLAGALRVERTRKTVAAPGTSLFDGNTLAWSIDRTRLAVVTSPDDPCTAGEREVAVIDIDTGQLRSVDRGAGAAHVAWFGDGRLAIVRAGGLTVIAADRDPQTIAIDAAWLWARTPPPITGCAPEPEPEPEPEPDPEPELPDTGDDTGSTTPDASR